MAFGKGFLKGAGVGGGALVAGMVTDSQLSGTQFEKDNPNARKVLPWVAGLTAGGILGTIFLRGGGKKKEGA